MLAAEQVSFLNASRARPPDDRRVQGAEAGNWTNPKRRTPQRHRQSSAFVEDDIDIDDKPVSSLIGQSSKNLAGFPPELTEGEPAKRSVDHRAPWLWDASERKQLMEMYVMIDRSLQASANFSHLA